VGVVTVCKDGRHGSQGPAEHAGNQPEMTAYLELPPCALRSFLKQLSCKRQSGE
jgi:hypothetical protein